MSDSGRVLVTGGCGFIGSHLVEELVRQGRRVTVVDDLSGGVLDNLAAVAGEYELAKIDLRTDDIEALLREQPFDSVFHLAGNAYVPSSVDDPRRDLEVNVVATFNVLSAMRAAGSTAGLVYTSSAAVYGAVPGTGPLGEDSPTFPESPYAVSKLSGEHYVSVFARIFGVRAASVRLFPVYGPRLRKQVIYDLMRKIHADPERLFMHGDGTQVRDFNHVANVVEALLLVARQGRLAGEVYNAGGNEPTEIGTLARLICEVMGVSPAFEYAGNVRPGDSQRMIADISRLEALGYRPRRRLAEGLAETAAWFRAETA